VVLLLLILPAVGYYLTRVIGIPPLVKDLRLLRVEGVIAVAGCILVGLAPTGTLLIPGTSHASSPFTARTCLRFSARAIGLTLFHCLLPRLEQS